MSGWDEEDWDIDDRVRKHCPLCMGMYMEEEKRGLTGFRSRTPHFFNHQDRCEAGVVPTETMLQLCGDEASVRAEVARLNHGGTA
ncbi:hypothetical protein B6E66_01270 [Streptomyces maremycinicus]|nr:hypothetical protein B6E66_01270 [Streptomyces sp. B9173]